MIVTITVLSVVATERPLWLNTESVNIYKSMIFSTSCPNTSKIRAVACFNDYTDGDCASIENWRNLLLVAKQIRDLLFKMVILPTEGFMVWVMTL